MKVRYTKVRDFKDLEYLQKARKFRGKSSFPLLFFVNFFLMAHEMDKNQKLFQISKPSKVNEEEGIALAYAIGKHVFPTIR